MQIHSLDPEKDLFLSNRKSPLFNDDGIVKSAEMSELQYFIKSRLS